MTQKGLRPALYYPYIHIRSEHWLKATLLCAPTVKRIVPETYTPEDLPSITRYSRIAGPSGPLLQEVPPSSRAAIHAQEFLLQELREHEKAIGQKFDRNQSPIADEYWIHKAKFNDELLDYLVRNNLAWPSEHRNPYGRRPWYAMHPVLGSAVMTVLGLSIAGEQHYDIVTPSADFHETLLTSRQEDVLAKLLTVGNPTPAPTAAQARHDLGQLVIALTGVNYQALQPEDIPELQASKSFQSFQALIRSSAAAIPRDEAPESYREELRRKADEIIEMWNQTRNNLSRGLRSALFAPGLALAGDALESLIQGAGVIGLAIGGGVAIGTLAHERRQAAAPYQYLTEILKAENEFLRMTFPLGLEP